MDSAVKLGRMARGVQPEPQLVPAGDSFCSVPSDLDHEGQMSTAFQAEDTL